MIEAIFQERCRGGHCVVEALRPFYCLTSRHIFAARYRHSRVSRRIPWSHRSTGPSFPDGISDCEGFGECCCCLLLGDPDRPRGHSGAPPRHGTTNATATPAASNASINIQTRFAKCILIHCSVAECSRAGLARNRVQLWRRRAGCRSRGCRGGCGRGGCGRMGPTATAESRAKFRGFGSGAQGGVAN